MVQTLRRWLADDAARNADKAISLTGLAGAAGACRTWLPFLGGALLVVAALPRLVRAPLREAAAGALLVGRRGEPARVEPTRRPC